jgi:hypothetical protein
MPNSRDNITTTTAGDMACWLAGVDRFEAGMYRG